MPEFVFEPFKHTSRVVPHLKSSSGMWFSNFEGVIIKNT